MAGFSSSVTVTVKLDEVLLPWMSVTEYVTVVVPTAKVSPLSCVEVKLATAQLSPAVGAVQDTSAAHSPASLLWLMSAGRPLMVGASSSVTSMSKLSELLLPWMSVAV